MQKILWMRTHVPIRNGAGGITTSFIEPMYQVTLTDRVFNIYKQGKLVTQTGIENVVEFTAEETPVEQETIAKKTRSRQA